MMESRVEQKWVEAFRRVLEMCALRPGDVVAILSETQSRAVNVQLAELAALGLGARAFHVVLPTPRQAVAVPIRSTGATDVIQGLEPVIDALGGAALVVDCSVEGMLHARELPVVLKAGARVLMVSNEHPEALERLLPTEDLERRVKSGIKLLRGARRMRVTSRAGTDLAANLEGAVAGGGWGYTTKPGTITHWPGGLCLCFPQSGAVSGTLVLDRGDVNLTFKRYLESPVRLTIDADYVTEIGGDGVDAELMRSYFAAWGDREAYAVSHLGWGMNPAARWDAMTMYDKGDFNGTELRAFAGNFLYSTGANEVAGRHTLGHFDLPLRNCTVRLDDVVVVDQGRLQGELV
jgi:2,5-dihydroxypyridine 5,6-dioxygenase